MLRKEVPIIPKKSVISWFAIGLGFIPRIEWFEAAQSQEGTMPRNFKQFTLDDRESIAIGIMRCQSLKKIAEHIGKHVSSVAKETKRHRIFVRGSYYAGNDCMYAKGCNKRHVCGDEVCPMYCYACTKDCHEFCNEYESKKCRSYDRPPYVCNHCENRRYCEDDKYFYDATLI